MAPNSSLSCDTLKILSPVFETRRFHYQHATHSRFSKRAFAMKSFQNRSGEIQKRDRILCICRVLASNGPCLLSLGTKFVETKCIYGEKYSCPIIQENNLICSITRRIQIHTQISYSTTFCQKSVICEAFD